MSEKRAVGKPMPRLDARDKVTGVYVYGMDISQPGMLHGKVVRSPHPMPSSVRWMPARQRNCPESGPS